MCSVYIVAPFLRIILDHTVSSFLLDLKLRMPNTAGT